MKNFIIKNIMLTLAVLGVITLGQAQDRSISGKVTDTADGSGIPGVNVLQKGTSNGSITDIDGNYKITVSEDATLVFSFVGYATQEIAVGSRTVLDVGMGTDVTQLAEVVVVGYGQQDRGDVTGVIENVSEESFNRGAIVSPDALIAGKVAGVQITSNSGEPGGQSTVRIRGVNSINASSTPLYVIDGVPIDSDPHNPGGFEKGRNALNFINPNDIESFTVLKDASAAAIYGSRAANGVIIITTKKGKAGTTKISYDGWASVANAVGKIDVLDGNQYREVAAAQAPDRAELLLNANTDWQAKVLQQAIGQSHGLTMSGGTNNTTYRFSLGYLEQEGTLKGTRTERTSFGLNLNQSLLDDDLTMDVNLKGSATSDEFTAKGGVLGTAVTFAPTQPVFDVNNQRFGGYWEWPQTFGLAVATNPISTLEQELREGQTYRSIGNIKMDYKLPLEGLTATVNLGYDITRGERKRFTPISLRSQATDSGEVRRENITRVNKLIDAYLTYKTRLEGINSDLEVLGGYSWQDFRNEFPSSRSFTLSTDIFGVNNPLVGSQLVVSNSIQENRLIAFFGRVNFNLNSKYLFTFNLRRDGSSRFGPENQWAVFPSAAFGWRILDEDFISAGDVVSDLKLRVGWGVTGNQGIQNNLFLSTYRVGDLFTQYQFGNDFITTVRPGGADPAIQWEETTQFNVGLEYGLFNNRLTGSVEYYHKRTDELVFNIQVPAGTNLTNFITTNIGELENKGVELGLNAVVVDKADFRWDLSFNVARNKNKIIDLEAPDDASFEGFETAGIRGGVGNRIQILTEGESALTYYVFKQKYGEDGAPLVDGVDHNEDGEINLADMYEDTDGDGDVDDFDRRNYKSPFPDYIFGLTSQIYLKNFDLSFTLRSNVGNYVYNNFASAEGNYNKVIADIVPGNMHTSVLETNFTTPQLFSDHYVENASFLRMDNITLGYTPKVFADKFNARFYVTVQNPFVITGYSGVDPEIGDSGNENSLRAGTFGVDNEVYPRSRIFIVGLSLNF